MSELRNIEVNRGGRSRGTGLRLVVLGGIGAGKSTVTALLAARGAVVIEADRIGHELLRPGHSVAESVGRRWPDVVDAAGVIDRARLASVVFADPEALEELESYTHPAIRAEVHARATAAGEKDVVVEMPILRGWFEGWTRVLVKADRSARIERAVRRGGVVEDIERRIAAQPGEAAYQAMADHVVVNDGDLEKLNRTVGELWDRLVDG